MPHYALYVFDAYGTLFDVRSAVDKHRAMIGEEADRLSDLWRTKQLEYTWVRTLCGAYRDFRQNTADALDFASLRCGGLRPELREALLAAYETLDAYPDVHGALSRLRAAGAQTAILSNGSPEMLTSAVRSAGLEDLFDACLSVDALRAYKPAPSAYGLVAGRFGLAPKQVSFQSSNRWDVAGAARFGFRAVWINRTGAPDEYPDCAPGAVHRGLDELAQSDV
ncbi:MAG TPA: haloacid dehalogenase type II [Beijerinckiaceae bacterium]|nr:haloacid dehalogenase type II [Beijerinckiaceae bacterium]